MKKYDIRDEYELHNLLRKLNIKSQNDSIEFTKMPLIRFGEFDRDEMIREVMLALAPVSTDELAEFINMEYGFNIETVKTQFDCIDEYYSNGIYTVDFEDMPENQKNIILSIFFAIMTQENQSRK